MVEGNGLHDAAPVAALVVEQGQWNKEGCYFRCSHKQNCSARVLACGAGTAAKGCCDLSLQFGVPPIQSSQITGTSDNLVFCTGHTNERPVLENEQSFNVRMS